MYIFSHNQYIQASCMNTSDVFINSRSSVAIRGLLWLSVAIHGHRGHLCDPLNYRWRNMLCFVLYKSYC